MENRSSRASKSSRPTSRITLSTIGRRESVLLKAVGRTDVQATRRVRIQYECISAPSIDRHTNSFERRKVAKTRKNIDGDLICCINKIDGET
jgi:hypothetical protein